MSETILEGLFDSEIKVKLLKLFLRNPEDSFTLDEMIARIKTDPSSTRYQLRKLHNIGLLKSELRRFATPAGEEQGKTRRMYHTNTSFPFYDELSSLVLSSMPISKEKLAQELTKLGSIRFALMTGAFVNYEKSRTDLVVVSDDVGAPKVEDFIKGLEADIGRAVRYTVMTPDEFRYRLDMYDNFLRGILQQPHQILIDTIRASV